MPKYTVASACLVLLACNPEPGETSAASETTLPETTGTSEATSTDASTGEPTTGSAAERERAALVDAIVRPGVDAGWLVGVSVVAIADGLTTTHHYGAVAQGGSPPDDDTLYEIGSVSKVFNALLLAEMAGRGEVALDQPVAELLPDTVSVPTKDGAQIRLVDLATHTSGLPPIPPSLAVDPDLTDPYVDYGADELYADLGQTMLTTAPGEAMAYSNYGAGLLGHVLARRGESEYEALLRARVLAPLGLDDTAIALDAEQSARLAVGHAEGEAVSYWRFDALAGAGALRSSAREARGFLAANLQPEGPLAAAIDAAQALHFDGGAGGQIGLAWQILPDGTRWHNGETGGFHSFVAIDRANQRALALYCNTVDHTVDALGAALLAALAGQPAQAPAYPTPVELPEATLEQFVGTYAFAPDVTVTISREGAVMRLQVIGQEPFRMFAIGPARFTLRVVDAEVEFTQLADGVAGALVLHQNGAAQVATRVP